MIRFLSSIGRGFTIVGTFVIIFVTTYEAYDFKGDLISIGLGFLGGCIVSGFLFGIVATLYDIRDNLRILVERGETTPHLEIPYITKPADGADDLRAL